MYFPMNSQDILIPSGSSKVLARFRRMQNRSAKPGDFVFLAPTIAASCKAIPLHAAPDFAPLFSRPWRSGHRRPASNGKLENLLLRPNDMPVGRQYGTSTRDWRKSI
jgi:hypothetical protein